MCGLSKETATGLEYFFYLISDFIYIYWARGQDDDEEAMDEDEDEEEVQVDCACKYLHALADFGFSNELGQHM